MNLDAASDNLQQVTLNADKSGVSFAITVKPRGRKSAVTGVRGNALIVSVTAAPVDGAANAAVITVLSDALQIPRSALSVARGHKSREKVVRVSGYVLEDVRTRITILPILP